MKTKIRYLFIIILIIILGLESRNINSIPLFIGDILRAMMIFYILLFLTNLKLKYIALFSIMICFGVEFSQAVHFELLDNIRNTFVGALLLGKGFLYTDLISYIVGILLCYIINFFQFNKEKVVL